MLLLEQVQYNPVRLLRVLFIEVDRRVVPRLGIEPSLTWF